MQIDFIAAFDTVNFQRTLYKLCYVGIGGSVSSVSTLFLSNQPQHNMVDGGQSKLVNVVSGVPQGSVLPVIVPSVHLGAVFHSGK